MASGILAGLEWVWVVLAVAGIAVHTRGLWYAYDDQRLLRRSGANGRRAIVAAMHVRNHWTRLAAKVALLIVAALLVTTPEPPRDHNAVPLVMTVAGVVVCVLLTGSSLADMADREELIYWYKS